MVPWIIIYMATQNVVRDKFHSRSRSGCDEIRDYMKERLPKCDPDELFWKRNLPKVHSYYTFSIYDLLKGSSSVLNIYEETYGYLNSKYEL